MSTIHLYLVTAALLAAAAAVGYALWRSLLAVIGAYLTHRTRRYLITNLLKERS